MSIHPTAVIDPKAEIDPTVQIGPYVVIEGPVKIGAETKIGPFSMIMGNTTIGERCYFHSHVIVGDIPQDAAYQGEQTFCILGDDIEIREGATVHRATGEGNATILSDGCYLMSNAHVGHNCELEREVVLTNGCLLGGHVYIGEKAIISGNAGVHQFCRIGTLSMVGGLSKITQDVPPFMMTDQLGNIIATNLIGLKRAGYNADQRREVKDAFRILYRDGLTHTSAMQILLAKGYSSALEPLIDFISETSRRGLCKGAA